ncbi:hypothetical protein BC938DRAFT_480870 [Jimgerdemannia flammicorona]|uniref:Uncharacterized protein n=1 Tax=Jimgerdemannia flammicorona TaxID=994334 RepID=A0A433QHM5_9FUNG|nr:hypothetical protein BC938DRAFT_480870 [Jimgerdemannia flammicorona]
MTITLQTDFTSEVNAVADPDTSSQTSIIQAIPFVDLIVPHSNLFDGASDVVLKLFPHWSKAELKFLQCKDGITNKRE